MGFFNWNNSSSNNNNNGGDSKKTTFSINNLSFYISDDLLFANLFYGKENITNDEDFKKVFPNLPDSIADSLIEDIGIILTDAIKEQIQISMQKSSMETPKIINVNIADVVLEEIGKVYGIDLKDITSEQELMELLERYENDINKGLINPLSPEEIMESNETLREELNSNEIKTPNISEDNLGFNLFKKFTKELGSKYEKYLDITM